MTPTTVYIITVNGNIGPVFSNLELAKREQEFILHQEPEYSVRIIVKNVNRAWSNNGVS